MWQFEKVDNNPWKINNIHLVGITNELLLGHHLIFLLDRSEPFINSLFQYVPNVKVENFNFNNLHIAQKNCQKRGY